MRKKIVWIQITKLKSTEKCRNTKQTQFTPTLSTPATLHTKKAVPPNWTVVLCAIICNEKKRSKLKWVRFSHKKKLMFRIVSGFSFLFIYVCRNYIHTISSMYLGKNNVQQFETNCTNKKKFHVSFYCFSLVHRQSLLAPFFFFFDIKNLLKERYIKSRNDSKKLHLSFFK